MFWERFYSMCLSVGSKPNPIGKQIGISSATITQWKQGATPAGDNLVKIANYFKCSADYLLGLDDIPNRKEKSSKSELTDLEQELLEKFKYLLDVDKGRILDRMTTIYESYSPEQKENVS